MTLRSHSSCRVLVKRDDSHMTAHVDDYIDAVMVCRYEDDKDEGEWFLYTGSGGRDLSGNKRVNKVQSFDQTFDKMNKALLLSCEKGLPVRVVRSHKVRPRALRPRQPCMATAYAL